MTRLACFVVAGAVILPGALPTRAEAPGAIQAPSVLDYEAFKTRVQPLFLDKRPGLARCYVCHSQGTPFRLQPLAQGATSWNEDASTKNFEAVRRYVVPGNPLTSRLLLIPLAAEAGGVSFHPGGRRWTSQSDPEWQMLADWVRGRPAGGAPR